MLKVRVRLKAYRETITVDVLTNTTSNDFHREIFQEISVVLIFLYVNFFLECPSRNKCPWVTSTPTYTQASVGYRLYTTPTPCSPP